MRSNPRAARRSDPGGISLLLALFLGALIAFWVLDVLVNLKLASAPFLGNELLGRPVDFFGLFIGGAQIAAVVAVGAWLAGTIIGTLVKRTSRRAEAVAALGAAAVALGVLAQSPSWSFVFRSFVSKVAFAGASGLVVWIPLRLLARRREAGASHLELVVQWVVVPTLVVGFALHGAKQGMHGSQAEAVVAGLWAVVLLAVCLACAVVRPGSRVVYAAWFPVVVALFMAGHSCYAFRTFGAPEPKGTVERVGSDRPAIFLIVMDTVRADHMKCFGYNRDTMPALEQWASGGATASRAISPAGWTTPAHASVFSGRTVSGHGVHYRSGTGMDHKLGTTPREGITWLPELLQDEGYYCLAASANALAFPEGIQGFDRMLSPGRHGWLYSSIASRVDNVSPLSRRLSERLCWRLPYVDAAGMADIVPRAVPDEGTSLFVFVNMLDAHSPYNPPDVALRGIGAEGVYAFSQYDQHRSITESWSSLPSTKVQHLADLYDGELRWIDMNLARLLAWIEERYGDGAIVIVTSDHGEELGEENRVGHEYGLAQRIIHVPLFLRGPGLRVGTFDDVVSTRSLFGFILACARGERPSVDMLLQADPDRLISERYPSKINAQLLGAGYDRAWVSLTDGEHKAVGPSSEGLSLYDIEEGGFDLEIALSDSVLRSALGTQIDEYWERSRDRRSNEEKPMTEEERRTLRSLGYLD